MADLPPLPSGFSVDHAASGLPPLPSGFSVDHAPAAPAQAPVSAGDRVNAVATGFNSGIAGLLGLPMDTAANVVDLVKAAAGTAYSQATGKPVPSYLEVDSDRSGTPGTSANVKKLMGAAAQLPRPEDPTQQYLSAGGQGASAALAGPAGGARVLPAVLSGVTAAEAQKVAADRGVGPAGQALAALAGGLAPGATLSTAGLIKNVGAGIVRPFTRSGQQAIAANVLQDQATNPQAAAARLDANQPQVEGSLPTTGAASGDVGLLSLEKAVRSQNPSGFGTRTSEQNAARQTALDQIAGSPSDVADAKLNRDATTGPMRETALKAANANTIQIQSLVSNIRDRFLSKASALQDKGRFDTTLAQQQGDANRPYVAVSGEAPVAGKYSPHAGRAEEAADASADMSPIIAQRQEELSSAQRQLAQLKASGASPLEIDTVTNRINGILRTPGLRASQVVQKALGPISDKLESLADENGVIDARDLYTVRKEIGNYVQQAAKDSSSWDKRLTTSLQVDVQHSIDNAIEGAAPGFKAYIQRYKDLSRPIDQMKILQDIQRRASTTAVDPSTQRLFLSSAQFRRALDGAMQKSGATLNPDQVQTLRAIRTDLDMGAAITGPTVKAPGSDTFQNLSVASAIGAGRLSTHPAIQALTRPLNWLYKSSDKQINDIIADAMLNPKLASLMLKQATPRTMREWAGIAKARAARGSLVSTAASAATQQLSQSGSSSQ